MAKTNFTYACGHDGVVVESSRQMADRKAKFLATKICWECERAQANAAAASAAQAAGLPVLTGTPKQIAYGNTLRQQHLAAFERAVGEVNQVSARWGSVQHTQVTDAVALLQQEFQQATEAKFWIELPTPGLGWVLRRIADRTLAPDATESIAKFLALGRL